MRSYLVFLLFCRRGGLFMRIICLCAILALVWGSGCLATKAVGGVAGFTRDTVVITTKTTGKAVTGLVAGTGKGTAEILKGAGKMTGSVVRGVTGPASDAVVGSGKAVVSGASTAGVGAAKVAAENPQLVKKAASGGL